MCAMAVEVVDIGMEIKIIDAWAHGALLSYVCGNG